MKRWQYLAGIAGLVTCVIMFVIPFIYIFFMAVMSKQQSSTWRFAWPEKWQFAQNFLDVIRARDYQLMTAYFNSIVITVLAVALLVVFGAMVGYVLQRRPSKWNKYVYALVLAGFMIPPAIVPTIWVLQLLGIYKTLWGMALIQVAYGLSFSVLLYRSFIASIPKELDEAAIVDGAKPWQVFFKVIFPLLKPVTVTCALIQAVTIFNDFTNPLYYLPGKNNVTVQTTLYGFIGQFQQQYNLLFMDILLITIPPLLAFLFFNKQIVAGMTSGAVKG
jgi:raffinose/stachyose/melibiose transport system permease protein